MEKSQVTNCRNKFLHTFTADNPSAQLAFNNLQKYQTRRGNRNAMKHRNIYSHTFVIGRLSVPLTPKDLWEQEKRENKNLWERVTQPQSEYRWTGTKIYSALIDSMQESVGVKRPDIFEKNVFTYRLVQPESTRLLLPLRKEELYPCTICNVNLHFFPFGFVFFSIEFDDTNVDLNNLTLMHSMWKEWSYNYPRFKCPEMETLLKPLTDMLPKNEDGNPIFTWEGSKARMYQIVQTDAQVVQDDLLYEIATFMPIGVVNHADEMPEKKFLKPSQEYFDRIMHENTISAFGNWKALALNDSFTVLASSSSRFDPTPHLGLYLPYLYMRCLFMEFFCFDRNNRYRTDIDGKVDQDVQQQLDEISTMDRYYFYDDVSTDFLPSMIHKAMAKGMELYTDRDELMGHIKESLDDEKRRKADERRRRNDTTLLAVKILASISVFVALFNMLKAVWNGMNNPWVAIVTLLLAAVSIYLMFAYSHPYFPFTRIKAQWMKRILNFFSPRKHDETIITSAVDSSISVILTDETREHIMTHFSPSLPGSKFHWSNPYDLLQHLLDTYPQAFSSAKPEADGRKRITIKESVTIGNCNVVADNKLNDEELKSIHRKQRGNNIVRVASSNREFPTKECQVILSSDNHIVTVFPGEKAPTLPATPDDHDEYWDCHLFIEKPHHS